jgi:hypothetical protein
VHCFRTFESTSFGERIKLKMSGTKFFKLIGRALSAATRVPQPA